jgi:hypothetical protein
MAKRKRARGFRKFKKGASCSTKPTMRKVGRQRRCVCVTSTGRWKFLPTNRCSR